MYCLPHIRINGPVRRAALAAIVTGMCLNPLAVSSAAAQTTGWSDRAFVNVNTTLQVTSTPLDENLAPIIYAERAVLTTTHTRKARQLTIEPAGGVRLWGNLGVGAALERRAADETATVRGLIPHPTLFNQPRVAAKDAPFKRSELTVHTYALVMLPLHPRLDVALFAGPSFISVRQDVIDTIAVAETAAPFTTVDISNVATVTRKVRTIGLNAGADVTWFLTRITGIGVTARYVRGYASTTLTDGTPVDLDVGGLQIGVGARLRFR